MPTSQTRTVGRSSAQRAGPRPKAPYPPPAGGGTQLGIDNVVAAIFGPVPETWDDFRAVASASSMPATMSS